MKGHCVRDVTGRGFGGYQRQMERWQDSSTGEGIYMPLVPEYSRESEWVKGGDLSCMLPELQDS